MMKLQWHKGTKRNADEKKFMMIFFLKAFRQRAKKNWRNVSVPPVSYPYSISAMVVNFFHTSAWRYASTHPFGTYSLQVVKVESVKPPS